MAAVIIEPKLEEIIFLLTDGNAFQGTDLSTIESFPYDAIILLLEVNCKDAPTGSALVSDFNVNDTSILSTKIRIDATQTTSKTSAVPYVLTTDFIAKGSRVSVDIDQRGATVAGSNVQLTAFLVRV